MKSPLAMTKTEVWAWREGILTCELLQPWHHGFFTRLHAPAMPADLQKYFQSGQSYHCKQVHGDRLVEVTDFDGESLPEADGVFSRYAQTSVWTCSADCVPILMGDRRLGNIAAVHSGWRGTAKNIVAQAVQRFIHHGSQLDDLVVALGPAISAEFYQVQTEVADQVSQTITSSVGRYADPKPGHCRLDLRLIQQQQFLEQGLNHVQIAIAPYCTFANPDLFFSYRRGTQVKPQIQWSGIQYPS